MKILPLAVLLGSATACSSSSDSTTNQNVTLQFMRHDNPGYLKADTDAFAEYTAAHPNVTIVDTTVTYPTLASTLLSDLKNNALAADLVRIQPSWLCTFADNLADVPDSVATLGQAQGTFFPAPLQGTTCNGKLKGIPVEYNLEYGGVVVNVDKYMAKFAKTPSWPTFDAFIADAAALSEFDGAGVPKANGLDIAPDWTQPVKHIFFSQILQRGGNYWSASGKTLSLQTAEAKASLAAMVDWVAGKKVMSTKLIPDASTFVTTRLAQGATGYGWGDVAKPLSIMGYCGTWGVPNTIDQRPAGSNTKYDYYTLPPMFGTQHKFVQNSGWAFGVPKTSKNQAAAWALIKAIAMSPEVMKKWSATTGSLPALRANGSAAAAADDPMLKKVQPLLDQGQWVGYIPATAIDTVEGAIVSNFFAAVAGKPINDALAEMEAKANAALAAAP
jgi:multiple sugar transport system substrate-binding protein